MPFHFDLASVLGDAVALAITVISTAGALAVAPIALYLLALVALSVRRVSAPAPAETAEGARLRRLVCVVPAHDEERGIAATVRSLLGADYPAELRRVVVVADNCSDSTAARARAAGADVIVRVDPVRRGKGFALEAGFAHVLASAWAEGVVVVDADTVVARNLWRAVSARLASGAAALQVTNAVRNPDAGWRPLLQSIAMATINGVRSLARESIGVSAGLRGTGMAFARETLERVPHRVYGVVEDVEYGVRLGLAGIRVAYAPETWIASDAPVSARAALSQRRRWEGGRLALLRSLFPRLARAALRETGQRRRMLADLALDLLVPPLAYPVVIAALGIALELARIALLTATSPLQAPPAASAAASLWLFNVMALFVYVLRGTALSGTGWRGFASLAAAPVYIVWKLVVARPWSTASARAATEWVRTQRERHDDAG